MGRRKPEKVVVMVKIELVVSAASEAAARKEAERRVMQCLSAYGYAFDSDADAIEISSEVTV